MLRNCRCAVGRPLSGRVRRALAELTVTLERTATWWPWPGSRWSVCTTRTRGRSARVASTARSSSDTRPRCRITTTSSSWTTVCNAAPLRRPGAPRGLRRLRLRPGRGRTRSAPTGVRTIAISARSPPYWPQGSQAPAARPDPDLPRRPLMAKCVRRGRESSAPAVRAERRSRPKWDPVDLLPGSRTKRSISELHECKLIELDE
jgi:hypothetical protein